MEGIDLDSSTVDTQNNKKKKDILGYFEWWKL
jgi:hypothetical protein